MKIAPFAIDVSAAAVADLGLRLEMTRWPDEVGEGAWGHGMPRKVLRDIVDYWRDRFDWRAAERRLNGSAPLVLTHGWPGSFVEMYKAAPRKGHAGSTLINCPVEFASSLIFSLLQGKIRQRRVRY
jgi:hypothetical protein